MSRDEEIYVKKYRVTRQVNQEMRRKFQESKKKTTPRPLGDVGDNDDSD